MFDTVRFPGGEGQAWTCDRLCRAALPLELLVPRRREPSRGAGRGSGAARARRARDHRPRRVLRRRALRGGGARGRAADGVRRGADARAPRQLPNGIADPPGEHLVVLAEGPVGYARLAQGDQRGAARGGEGRAALVARPSSPTRPARPCTSRQRRRAARNDPWFVLTGCRKGTVPAALQRDGPARGRTRRSPSWSTRSAATGCSSSCGTTAIRSTGTATTRSRRSRCVPGVEVIATNNVHYATPARRPLATALAAVRARRSLDEIDGWLPAAPFAHLRSAVRAGAALRALAGRGRAHRRDRARVRVRPEARGARAARLPGARRARRDVVVARAGPARRGGRVPAVAPAARPGDAPDRLRAVGDRAARLPRLLPAAARHRRVLPPQRHLLPGPGERGEQRGLLRARGHQGRRGRARPAVRTVPVTRARRSARHRPRHRAPTPRRSDPVRLRALRPRPRRAGRERHHLPAPLRAAGDGEGRRASRPARPTRSGKWVDRWAAGPEAFGELRPPTPDVRRTTTVPVGNPRKFASSARGTQRAVRADRTGLRRDGVPLDGPPDSRRGRRRSRRSRSRSRPRCSTSRATSASIRAAW